MEENKAIKPDYIENQVNNNCQQFFGPVSGCVFAMPGSDVHMPEPKSTGYSMDLQNDQAEAVRMRRVKAVANMDGLYQSDWAVVFKLLVIDDKFVGSAYEAGAAYINEICGEEVTSAKSISTSRAMDLIGNNPLQWKFKNPNRESGNLLSRYQMIAKVYMNA